MMNQNEIPSSEQAIEQIGVRASLERVWMRLQDVDDGLQALDLAALSAQDRSQYDQLVMANAGFTTLILELGEAEEKGETPPLTFLKDLFLGIAEHAANSLTALKMALREQQGLPMQAVAVAP